VLRRHGDELLCRPRAMRGAVLYPPPTLACPELDTSRMPFRSALVTSSALMLLLAVSIAAAPTSLAAQGDASRSDSSRNDSSRVALGLSAVGAFTVHGGGARVERHVDALEIGGQLDLGHLVSRRVRISTDVSFLRSFPMEERIDTEGKTYRDSFFDLSGSVMATLLGAAPSATITPYIGGGVGVHALSSNFGSIVIDTRYNANKFGLLATAGVRARVGQSGRRAVTLELRRVQVSEVSRASLHLGIVALFNDLARR
jgi:hypothetical protein